MVKMHTMVKFLNEGKCVKIFLKYRWPDGPHCPFCGSKNIIRYGRYEKYYHRYLCKDCSEKNKKLTVFNDKTCTIFEGTKLRLTTWFLAGYLMKLGLSNNQIAEELNIEENTARRMCNLMRGSMFFHNCLRKLSGTVEIDEAYQTAGSKGNGINTQQGNKSKGIKKDLGRKPRKRGLKKKGRGSYRKDKPPVIGMVGRESGTIHLEVTMDVKSDTLKPIIEHYIEEGSTIYTDDYAVYDFLASSGYIHESVNHSAGEYARGEVHINTQEGVWSLFRPSIEVGRGINKERLPLYTAGFEFFRNIKKKGEDVLNELIKVCLNAPARDLLNLERNLVPPLLCPEVPTMF
jgi:transposase-like protein